MEELLNSIAERSKRVGLTEAEREVLRVRLVEYAARPRAAGGFVAFWVGSWARAAFALRASARPVLATAVIIAVLGSGAGVSYAAEGAVPGDALYGFKLDVNEEVILALTVTPEAKARWETRRAERRLEEAEALASSGELDVIKAAALEDKIRFHAANVEKNLAEIGKGGRVRVAAEIGSELEGALQGHAAVIGRLSERQDGRRNAGAEGVIGAVENQISRTAARRSDSERAVAGPDNRQAAEASLAEAGKKLAAVEGELDEARPRLPTESIDQVGVLVGRARTAIEAGRSSLAEEKFNEAFSAFQEAARCVQQAKMLINAEKKWPARSPGRDRPRTKGGGDGAANDRRQKNGEQQRSAGRGPVGFGRD